MARVLMVIYDNESYIHWFPQGIAYLSSFLKQRGHEVTVYNQDVHHYPNEHLTEYLDTHQFDFVGVGVIAGYYEYRRLMGLAQAIGRAKNRPFFMLGGHGPSPEPAYFLRKTCADAVVMGEGELTASELLEAVSAGRPLASVEGIAFRTGDEIVVNQRRPLVHDIDTLPWPDYDAFPIEYYRLLRGPNCSKTDLAMPVNSGRGCPFKCTFCYRIDEGFRPRSAESIVEEVFFLQQKYGVTYVLFSDELLMSSVDRTATLCESFLSAGLKFRWSCNGRLNYARPKILELMKRAGCVFINYGIEALDDTVLKNMKKALRVKQIIPGIKATLAAGISPGLNVIFGNIGDTLQTLEKAVEFLLEHDDGAQMRTIRPVTPYPGSELYYEAIKRGLVKDAADFYENKHVNSDLVAVNFTDLSDDEFHQALLEANTQLIRNYFHNKTEQVLEEARNLYLRRNTSFRGFRQM